MVVVGCGEGGGVVVSLVEGSEAGFGCSTVPSGCVVFDLVAHPNKKKTVMVTNKIPTK